jgi:hypothetical protein
MTSWCIGPVRLSSKGEATKEQVQVIMVLEKWERDGEQGEQVLMVMAEVDGSRSVMVAILGVMW